MTHPPEILAAQRASTNVPNRPDWLDDLLDEMHRTANRGWRPTTRTLSTRQNWQSTGMDWEVQVHHPNTNTTIRIAREPYPRGQQSARHDPDAETERRRRLIAAGLRTEADYNDQQHQPDPARETEPQIIATYLCDRIQTHNPDPERHKRKYDSIRKPRNPTRLPPSEMAHQPALAN